MQHSSFSPRLPKYFKYNSLGQLCINHGIKLNQSTPITNILTQAKFQGLTYPAVIHFEHIVKSQLHRLYDAFGKAIYESNYTGKYSLAYPIKVNPDHKIVKAMRDYHDDNTTDLGYEVGSKSELLAVLSTASKTQRIVCNGFKDLSFYKIAQIAAKIGYRIIMVIENIKEISNIQELLDEGTVVRFQIGIRTKPFDNCLHTQKFGLSLSQIIECTDFLSINNIESRLVLLHSHIGSQLNNLNKFTVNIQRLLKIFSELQLNFANLKAIDFGGGLAINYDNKDCPDYDFLGYAKIIVEQCKHYAEIYGCNMPDIITESGRAITAESALLITKPLIKEYESDSESELLHQKWLNNEISMIQLNSNLPENQKTTQQAWLNFSLFQSLPDHWGVGQNFPILPLEAYTDDNNSQVKLFDISCDVDGVIKSHTNYIDIATDNIEYVVFMCVGAYQTMLSAKHNMLGNTSVVNIGYGNEKSPKISVIAAENYHSLLQQYSYNSLKLQSNLKRHYYYQQDELCAKEEDFLDNLFVDNPYMSPSGDKIEVNHANMAG